MFFLLQVVMAFIYSLFLEWWIHKYLLHKLGKKKKSIFSFHYHDHHSKSIRYKFKDPTYQKFSLSTKNGSGKEIISLLVLNLIHLPLFIFLPYAYITLFICSLHYLIVHFYSHKNVEWCRDYLPWHYAHHMGPNQDANWGVRFDWIDRLMGTRKYYVRTTKEFKDDLRRKIKHTNNSL